MKKIEIVVSHFSCLTLLPNQIYTKLPEVGGNIYKMRRWCM